MTYWKENHKWIDKYRDQITSTLSRDLSSKVVAVIDVAVDEGVNYSTDRIFEMEGGKKVITRLRKIEYMKYLEWTIVASRPSGVKTELSKLRDGFGDFYFYGYVNDTDVVKYFLFDLNLVRKKGILEWNFKERTNRKDGSSFVVVPFNMLQKCGALIREGP